MQNVTNGDISWHRLAGWHTYSMPVAQFRRDCGTLGIVTTAISLEAAIAITQLSKRTLWRRVSDGAITKISDAGARTLLALADIKPLIVAPLSAEDLDTLVEADEGNAEAQDDMAQLFLAAGRNETAHYWLNQAVKQDYPNAMLCLSRCYLAGEGVPQDENLGIMWLAKAAAHGHVIAQAQMRALCNRAAPCAP